MSKHVALCADGLSVRSPELLGLEGERLDAQEWLEVYTMGVDARSSIAGNEALAEAWVVSCEDVEAINLAATLKHDNPQLPVRLVDFSGDGSLLSRAHTAQLDQVLDRAAFSRRYGELKSECSAFATQVSDGSDAAAIKTIPSMTLVAEGQLELPRSDWQEPHRLALPQHAGEIAPPRHGRAQVLPIVSGSGGSGKSSIAVIAAIAARDRGFRTLLLDFDLQFGDMAVMAGVPDALAIDEAMRRPDLLDREISKGLPLTVLAAPDRIEVAEEVVEAMPRMLDKLTDSFEVIVANTGAAWAEQHAVLLERSTAALFVVDQRASSVRACRHALELCARCGIAAGPFRFVVNRCGKNALLTSIDVSSALDGVPVMELKDGGRDVEDYLGGGNADELIATGNEFCASVVQVVGELLPADEPSRAVTTSERLFSRHRGKHAGRRRGRK